MASKVSTLIMASTCFTLAACDGFPVDETPVIASPTAIGDMENVETAEAGGFHSIAAGERGGVVTFMAWGHNVHGQLGVGALDGLDEVPSPEEVSSASIRWVSLSLGALHSLGVDEAGRLWAWGYGEQGQLGLGVWGDNASRDRPTRVGQDTDWAVVAAGGEHSLAVKTDGSLWAWGYDNTGQLGLGSVSGLAASPVRVDGDDWVGVTAGAHHSAALKRDGRLFVWGSNRYGQLGAGDAEIAMIPSPLLVEGGPWSTSSAGGDHMLALHDDGSLWAWGRSEHGQAGRAGGVGVIVRSPERVASVEHDLGGASGTTWTVVSAGYFHSLALRSDGTMWAWGDGEYGQVGVGSKGVGVMSEVPAPVGEGRFWEAVSAGFFHSLATSDGELYGWGRSEFGQVGVEL